MDKDEPKERRIGFYAYEEIGMGSVHLDDLVLMGQAVKEVDTNGIVSYTILDANGNKASEVYRSK